MDVAMGMGDGIKWWKDNVNGWQDQGNYQYLFTGSLEDVFSEYGSERLSDDFAEMFVWYVLTTNPSKNTRAR